LKGAADKGGADAEQAKSVRLGAQGKARLLYPVRPQAEEEAETLRFRGETGSFADEVVRRIKVVPEGYPVAGSRSDVLRGKAQHAVELPPAWVKGSLRLRLEVFPTALAELRRGLDGLRQGPPETLATPTSGTYSTALLYGRPREAGPGTPAL